MYYLLLRYRARALETFNMQDAGVLNADEPIDCSTTAKIPRSRRPLSRLPDLHASPPPPRSPFSHSETPVSSPTARKSVGKHQKPKPIQEESSPIDADTRASSQRQVNHFRMAQDTASAVEGTVTPFLDEHPPSPLEQLYQLDLNDDTANRMLAQLVEYLAITTPSPRNGGPRMDERSLLGPKELPVPSVSTPPSTPAIHIVGAEPLDLPSSSYDPRI